MHRAALAQAERLEDLVGDLDLLDRVGGERDADRVADPVDEQRAHPDGALDRARERRARLGDAEVERVRHLLGEHPVGADHRRHVARLDGDLEVVEVEALEQAHLLERRLDERLRLVAAGRARRGASAASRSWRRSASGSRPCFAAATTSATLSGPPMLPGLMRTAATPPSIAFSARLALKWMSAMTGTGESRTISRQRLGVLASSAPRRGRSRSRRTRARRSAPSSPRRRASSSASSTARRPARRRRSRRRRREICALAGHAMSLVEPALAASDRRSYRRLHSKGCSPGRRAESPLRPLPLRRLCAVTLDDVQSLIDAPSPAVLTTYRKDGSALTTPVWFRFHEDAFEVVLAEGDVKRQHLARTPTLPTRCLRGRAAVSRGRGEGRARVGGGRCDEGARGNRGPLSGSRAGSPLRRLAPVTARDASPPRPAGAANLGSRGRDRRIDDQSAGPVFRHDPGSVASSPTTLARRLW